MQQGRYQGPGVSIPAESHPPVASMPPVENFQKDEQAGAGASAEPATEESKGPASADVTPADDEKEDDKGDKGIPPPPSKPPQTKRVREALAARSRSDRRQKIEDCLKEQRLGEKMRQ